MLAIITTYKIYGFFTAGLLHGITSTFVIKRCFIYGGYNYHLYYLRAPLRGPM